MQTMDMGSAEAALTQIAAMPAASSSYFLQLDPSGHIDILESSLVLSKPDLADETVYEIQLDSYMMDEPNVEIINLQQLQQLQNSITLPEFLEDQSFSTPVELQVQYQFEDINFGQMLANNAGSTEVREVEQEMVPDFTVETEVATEVEIGHPEAVISSTPAMPFNSVIQYTNPTRVDVMAENYGTMPANDILSQAMQNANCAMDESYTDTVDNERKSLPLAAETLNIRIKEEPMAEVNDELLHQLETPKTDCVKIESIIKEEVKEDEPTIMDFVEEAVIPPLVEMYPTSRRCLPPPVVTIQDDDQNLSENKTTEVFKPKFLYDFVDPDDELYISYHSRSDAKKTAMCILCYEWFDTLTELDAHLKGVHQDNMKLYGCKKCGKKFWSRFLRQRHEKQHRYDLKGPINRYFPKDRPFDHYESNHFYKGLRPAPWTEKYRDKLRLLHSQIKSTEFECFQCTKEFQTEEEYREHYEEEHALQTCIHCRKVFENTKFLRKHEQEVHGLLNIKKNYPGGAWKLWESWDCEEMKERDERLVNLSLYHNYTKRRRNMKQSGDVTEISCDVGNECEEVTVSDYEVAKTIDKRKSTEKSHSTGSTKRGDKGSQSVPVDSPKVRKTDVKLSSSKLQDFDKIVFVGMTNSNDSNVKREDLPFKCDTCETSFDNDIDLQRHQKSHGIRSMAYMCQYCGRGFATHSNRKEHERIHTGDKPYVCPICTRAFVQISNLKKHIQTHKDKNNLQCSTCNKQFVKESSLILHQRAHSQDRKFRCHICDRAYNYASLLKRHMRIHTGENPYSCEDCGQQFHELVSLHYHRKKVHTGERPHRCETCGRAFILSSDLKKHLKIHLRDGNSIKSRSDGGSPNGKASKNHSSSLTSEQEKMFLSEAIAGAVDSALSEGSDNTDTSVDINNSQAGQTRDSTEELHSEIPDEDLKDESKEKDLEESVMSDDEEHLVISETNLLNTIENHQDGTQEPMDENCTTTESVISEAQPNPVS